LIFTGVFVLQGLSAARKGCLGSDPNTSDMRREPQKKKDQLSLAQYWGMLLANRPDPDNPGGLGAEESGAERTGPTQDLFVAT
jgi:hypothetical protein